MILPILEGEAYQDLAKAFSDLPSSTALKKLVKELNRKWNITPTPNGTFGVYVRDFSSGWNIFIELHQKMPHSGDLCVTIGLYVFIIICYLLMIMYVLMTYLSHMYVCRAVEPNRQSE